MARGKVRNAPKRVSNVLFKDVRNDKKTRGKDVVQQESSDIQIVDPRQLTLF